MKNIAVDVEVNFQIRREKLKAGAEKNNIVEVKIEILVRKIEERIQNITMKDNFFLKITMTHLFHKKKRFCYETSSQKDRKERSMP